jgi:hypothetical protein
VKVVQCPRCGHENRAAISLSICDRCGADISTLLDLRPGPTERDLRATAAEALREEVTAAMAPELAPSKPAPEAAPPAPTTPWARRAAALIGRLLLAVAALALGVATGISLTAGSALQADQYIAGSVAILASATAISGLVMLLTGSSPKRSERITLGLRTLGFVLTLTGVWAVTTIAVTSARETPPEATAPDFAPGMMMRGPTMGSPPAAMPGMAGEPPLGMNGPPRSGAVREGGGRPRSEGARPGPPERANGP